MITVVFWHNYFSFLVVNFFNPDVLGIVLSLSLIPKLHSFQPNDKATDCQNSVSSSIAILKLFILYKALSAGKLPKADNTSAPASTAGFLVSTPNSFIFCNSCLYVNFLPALLNFLNLEFNGGDNDDNSCITFV